MALAKKTGNKVIIALSLLILGVGSFAMILPFIWMVSTSFKIPGAEYSFPPEWLPIPATIGNYIELFSLDFLPYGRFFLNSIYLTAIITAGCLFFDSLAAFAFAKLHFWKRDTIFLILLSSMMLPVAVRIIPLYLMMRLLHWLDTYLPLILPRVFAGIWGTFLLRQFFLTIPDDLLDAAKIDGCSFFGIYWQIMLPLAKPALITLAVIASLATWNDFLQPLIYLSSLDKYTVQVGLAYLVTDYEVEWRMFMAGSTLAVVPILLVYVFLQKHFTRGIVMSGIKG